MQFNSFLFAGFFVAVFAAYWLLPRRFQNPLLLVASYLFYGSWDWRFLSLIWVSTLVDFTIARRMEGTDDDGARRRLLLASIGVNLGILGVFKYAGFFVDSFSALVEGLGLQANPVFLSIVLPVGISFYTFQTLGYSIDVYRRQIPAERNLLTFALYVAYFPQLVAGPIERAKRLLPQMRVARTRLEAEALRSGSLLILLGLVKKVVIADTMAPIANQAFANAGAASWLELLLGVYAFSLQIYGDFSGYSSIARGASRLLGIELMVNFRQPYLSTNITDFWRTWHISLSTWLRDYLYIPLGGNRGTSLATYRNLMLTMLLGGLWHGASWTFVVWGGLHGLYLAAHRRWRPASASTAGDPWNLSMLVPTVATFHLVAFAWIFFRAQSFGQATDVITGIVTLRGGVTDFDRFWLVVLIASGSLALDLWQRNAGTQTVMLGWRPALRGAFYGGSIVALVLFSGAPPVPFIYFQF